MIEVTNLVKRYNDVLALDHFNLNVKKGEIFGLLGPNGSGKTTAINCMLSLLNFDKGEIKLFGEEMSPTNYDTKRKIGVIFQNVAVFEELTVYENIDYFCSLYVSDKKIRQQYVEEAIDFVGLQQFKKFVPKKLSGGLLRRLNIACGIAHKPELIFFDEPTVAVDPQSRNNILEGIKKLNEQGATIIYTSHYMEEVEQLCSRIMIMDKGKSIATGTKEQLVNMIKAQETIKIELFNVQENLLNTLRMIEGVSNVVMHNDEILISTDSIGSKALSTIIHTLNKTNTTYGKLSVTPPTLNQVFLEITGKNLRDQ